MADVHLERLGSVLLIEMNRPNTRNSMSGTLLADLADAFDEARRDDSIHVVVTIGRGDAFSVGAHLPDLVENLDLPTLQFLNGTSMGGDKGIETLTEQQMWLEEYGIGRWTKRMLQLDKPTIAAVNGAAAGGGFALAVLHDYRLAASNARLTTAWAQIGVGPEMATSVLLPRIVGHRIARDLLLRSPVLGAAEAEAIGLVDEVLEPDELRARALSLAEQLAASPPLAVRATKRLTRLGLDAAVDEALRAEYQTFKMLLDAPGTRQNVDAYVSRLMGPRR